MTQLILVGEGLVARSLPVEVDVLSLRGERFLRRLLVRLVGKLILRYFLVQVSVVLGRVARPLVFDELWIALQTAVVVTLRIISLAG